MKFSKYLFAVPIAVALLTGCQGEEEKTDQTSGEAGVAQEETTEGKQSMDTTDDANRTLKGIETDDSAIADLVEEARNIESYQAMVDLEALVDDESSQTLDADVKYKEGTPPSLHLKSEGEDRTISKDGETYYNNGDDWVDISESIEIEQLFHVTYKNAVIAFSDIKDEMKLTEEENQLIYTFEGESTEIFEVFESLFAAEFSAIDTSNPNNEVEVVIDKENSRIKSIQYEATGEDAEGRYELSGEVEFKSFNDIGAIQLPESVD
ncbi:hypothetical protein ACFPFV_06750 [Salinicoccus siamensis]|uniref:Lipoprotein n=1 Tax=Salinicoccus siamensis TaxID=381830 RepID=A0ABV5Z5K7_9STAP